MPKILYPQVIQEDPHELEKLEKHHRYTHLFQRVRMLRLLKSGECSNLGEAADALGYSWRQCQRWFASYREGGLQELLKSRVDERGRQEELVTPEAFEELQEAMKRGEIATIGQAQEFLSERAASSIPTPTVWGSFSGAGRSRAQDGQASARESRHRGAGGFQKNFADRVRQAVRQGGRREPGKPLKVLAFDEARFGLINWHRGGDTVRRGFVHLTSSGAPTSGPTCMRRSSPPRERESFCLYLPGMDSGCLQSFLEGLSEAYPEHHLLVVLDGAPSHRSEEIICPENIDFLRLPAYSPELDPVER